MKSATLLLVAALLMPRAALAVSDPLPRNPPYIMMRALQSLQEQIAHGNAAAQAAQPKLMVHIAEEFEAAEPNEWSDVRNAHAAVLFLLSGGNPAVVRSILEKATMPAEVDQLIKGSLAYAEGQDDVARTLLSAIDPRTLPTTLGGHLALIEATLLSGQDGAKANALLDLARLLVPGTLVEEAALRRQIFLLGEKGPADKFALLSRQYMRRYRASIFADNFRRRFMSVAAGYALRGDIASLTKLDPVFAEMAPLDEVRAYLDIARLAVLGGQIQSARMAAGRATVLAKAQSQEATRAALYMAAAMIATEDYDQGRTLLAGVDRSRLSDKDVGLFEAARDVADSVRTEVPDGPQPNSMQAVAAAEGTAALPALLEKARATLKDSDDLLAQSKQ